MNLKKVNKRIEDASVSGMIHNAAKKAGKAVAKGARTLFNGPSKASDETVDEFSKIIEGQAAAMLAEGRKDVKGESMLCIKITPPVGVNLKGQEPLELRGVSKKGNAIYAFYMPKNGAWNDNSKSSKVRDIE